MAMRVAGACALLAGCLAGLGGSCAAKAGPLIPTITAAGVRFAVRRPEAWSVALAGSFNQWSTSSHPLTQTSARGLWTIVVALPPGEHTFMYLVNGTEWVTPPLAEDYVDDGFGARNGVVVVRP
jgi:1,4-alpha-glucan branching enzyme